MGRATDLTFQFTGRSTVAAMSVQNDSAELQGSFLDLPGRRLWIEQAGEGPAVVFVHSGVTDRRMWDGQVAALADRYHVIRYDHPGYGRSEAATEPYSPVAELDAVLDHAGVEQAAVVGCSMGGMIVVDYTLAHPERVAALVTAAAGLTGFPWQPPPAQVQLEAELTAASKAGDHERIVRAAVDLYSPLHTDPDVDERLRRLIADNTAAIAVMGTKFQLGQPAYGRISGIQVPTLVVVGDRDLDDFVRIARLLASEIDGARLDVLPDVDHIPPVRAEQAFTDLLAGFLDGLDIPQ